MVSSPNPSQEAQRERRLTEAGEVDWVLEIEDRGRLAPAGLDPPGKSRLAHLARAEDGHDRMAGEQQLHAAEVKRAVDDATKSALKIERWALDFQGIRVDCLGKERFAPSACPACRLAYGRPGPSSGLRPSSGLEP